MQSPTGRSDGGPAGQDEGATTKEMIHRQRRSAGGRPIPVLCHTRHISLPSCEHELGPLPIPPAAHRGKTTFPHNVAFRAADWPAAPIPEDAAGYDVVVGCVFLSFTSTRERVCA